MRGPVVEGVEIGTLSIVIPTLDEERLLGGLLSDLAVQSRPPDEVFVLDAGSEDDTVGVAGSFPFVEVLGAGRPVALGRNAGGRRTGGDVVLFVDADARLSRPFLEKFSVEFEERSLDIACPLYYPHQSTWAVGRFRDLFNLTTRAFQGLLPSGAGTAVRGEIFRRSAGFDPSLKFDDIELIRRLSKGRRFGIVEEEVRLSDRRHKEQGVLHTRALIFALGRYRWANGMDYAIGEHGG